MHCFKCKKKLDIESKIGFKQTCPFCDHDLHICKNCKFYYPGKPNECIIPNSEFVADREKYNFCEDFKFRNDSDKKSSPSIKDIEKKLFGN